MEKYGVLKELKCEECGETIIVPHNELQEELEKNAHRLIGHTHVWKEVTDGAKEG